MASTILEMQNITKLFPGVKALDNVSVKVEEGEIHALVGENGAGKSTLMNILSGIYPYGTYEGKIIFQGKECRFKSIRDSERKGIVIIHQEFALIPLLSIAENMYLGNERAKSKVIDWNRTHNDANENIKKGGLSEDSSMLIKNIKVVNNVSINVRKGEVVGFSGIMGAGRTEFAMSVFGKLYGRDITGTIIKDGKEIVLNNAKQAIQNGLAYVTEDRKSAGLNLTDSIMRNIAIAGLEKISRKMVIDENREIQVAEEYRKKLDIKSSTVLQKAGNLSGGNQQKVVLSKWIFTGPDVLILDEPTRGIDVGAKYEIYMIINKLAEEERSVILISSELPEILGMCDRIYVMNEGRIVGELDKSTASQESIMKCIMNSTREVYQ